MNEKEVLEKLLVDEKVSMKRLGEQVLKAGRLFKIEAESGKILFENFMALADPQRIALLLSGKYFAKKLDIKTPDALGVAEIATELHRPRTALSGPLKQLVDKGWIEKLPHRKYKIVVYRIDEVLNEAIKKINK